MDDSESHTHGLGQDVHKIIDAGPENFTLTASDGNVPSPLALGRAAGSPAETEISFSPTSFDPCALISLTSPGKDDV